MGGWSTIPNLNVTRSGLGGAGTQAAALYMGGTDGTYKNTTEEFNGTAWIFSGNLNTGRAYLAACGSQDAAACFGGTTGSIVGYTEEYNGATWTSKASLNQARSYLGGAGSLLGAIAVGGNTGSRVTTTEEYNGITWGGGGNLSEAKDQVACAGTQTAGLCSGGWTTGSRNITELYDGAIWGFAGNLNAARHTHYCIGSQSSALAGTGMVASTYLYSSERFNGNSWAINSTNTTRIGYTAGAGDATSGIRAGGYSDLGSQNHRPWAEEYNQTYESYSWATGPVLSATRYEHGGAGTVGAGLVFGGAGHQDSEEFNGTAWSAGGGLSAIKRYNPGSAGVQTAALCCGGYEGSANVNKTELYNGASWSLSGVINTARRNLGAAGTTVAAVCFGGFVAAAVQTTEEFDGAVWTAVNNMITAVQYIPGCGTQTAALTCGGNASIIETEKYDGTNWSLSGNLNAGRFTPALVGLQDAAMVAAGAAGGGGTYLTSTEKFNGSAWTTGLNMNIGSQYNHSGGIGSINSMMVAGGYRSLASPAFEGIEIYTGAVPVVIDGPIFNSYSESVIVQVFPPPFSSAGEAELFGVFRGRYFDLTEIPMSGQGEFLAESLVFIPLDVSADPLASIGSMLADVHVTAIIRATLPALTASLDLNVRSGFINETLPGLIMEATGQIGSVGRIQTNFPALIIDATGLSGNIGSISTSLPRFTITISLLSEGKGTIVATLPAFYVNMHGEVSRAEVVFKVMAANLRNFAVTEYEGFNFNSFAELNGILLGAKDDGIYPLVGDKDQGQPIDANISTGQALIEFFRVSDIYINSRTGGQRRAKMPKGLKPGYIKFDVENINGGDLDVDSIQVYGVPVKRKKQ